MEEEVVDVLAADVALVDAAARAGVAFTRRRPPPRCNSASSSINCNSVALQGKKGQWEILQDSDKCRLIQPAFLHVLDLITSFFIT